MSYINSVDSSNRIQLDTKVSLPKMREMSKAALRLLVLGRPVLRNLTESLQLNPSLKPFHL